MAQFFTNFNPYTTDAQPSDWTERWDAGSGVANVRNSGIPSGGGIKALEMSVDDTVHYALSWDAVGTPSGDVEVVAKMLAVSSVASSLRVGLHGSGATGSKNEYLTDWVSGNFRLGRYVNGSFTQLSTAAFAASADTWYWVRLQRTGSTIRARIWADGNPEPGTWPVAVSDGNLSSGHVHISLRVAGTKWVDAFGVGTGGDAAPTEAPAAGSMEVREEDIEVVEVDFGTTDIGTPVQKVLQVHAVGGPINISDITVPEGSSVVSAPTSIAADESEDLTLQLDADEVASPDGTVTITSDADNSPYQFDVTGIVQKIAGQRFYTDYREYALAQQPNDWTQGWDEGGTWQVLADGGAVGGKLLQNVQASSDHLLLTWDDIGTPANVEILAKIRTSTASDTLPLLVVRASGAGGTETGYFASGVSFGETQQLIVGKRVPGGGDTIATADFAWLSDTWYWIRFRAIGNTLKAKIWAATDPEWPAWYIDVNDHDITAGGGVGLANIHANLTRDFDVFSIGTNGLNALLTGPARHPVSIFSTFRRRRLPHLRM